jgi:hypothetical protein
MTSYVNNPDVSTSVVLPDVTPKYVLGIAFNSGGSTEIVLVVKPSTGATVEKVETALVDMATYLATLTDTQLSYIYKYDDQTPATLYYS